jgi:hypothetical protein
MTGISNVQDYSLETLIIHTSVASFDLKLSMIEMSYVEDLFASVCSGYVFIAEASGFIETLALNGTEYLRVRFSKFGDNNSVIDKLFRVYKVSRRKLEGTTYKESYMINFCSDELLLSEQYKISKRYKNSLISDNINDILKNYLQVPTKRTGIIERTYGQYDLIIPTLKPFDRRHFDLPIPMARFQLIEYLIWHRSMPGERRPRPHETLHYAEKCSCVDNVGKKL